MQRLRKVTNQLQQQITSNQKEEYLGIHSLVWIFVTDNKYNAFIINIIKFKHVYRT